MEGRLFHLITLRLAFIIGYLTPGSLQFTAPKNSLHNSIESEISIEFIGSLSSHILEQYFGDSCVLAFLNKASADHLHGSLFGSERYSVINVEELDGDPESSEDSYVREILVPSMEIGCAGHIIQTADPQAQLSIIVRTYVKVSQRIQRRFLILPLPYSDHQKNSTDQRFFDERTAYLYDVFRSDIIRHVPNLLVAIPTREEELALYTHHFGGPGNAFRQLVLLDIYSPKMNTFGKGADLFPDKIVNLKGRLLSVSVLEYPPYVATDSKTGELFGTEWNVVIEFCRRHNCTLKPLIDNVYLFGEIFDNATGNGVLGNVVEDRADVGFGSIDLWYHEWLFLDLGPAFVRTAVTCLVPPPHPLAQWTTPIIPFDGLLWCAVIASIIIDSVIIWGVYTAANWIRQTSDQPVITPIMACLTAVGLSVEQSLSTDVSGGSRRVLIFALLLVSLLISTAYGSGLSSILTVPRFEKPIDTIEELEASGIKWSAPHEAWIFSLYGSNESWLLNLIDHFVVLPPNLTTTKAYEAEMGFCVERLPGGNYAIQDYLPAKAVENLHLMSGDIYWTYTVSMLRKSSPLTERYTALELELLASGIPSYWESVCVMFSLDPVTQYAVPDVVFGSQPVQLDVAQIQGAFLFLCFGLVSAMIIFACEISAQHLTVHS